jgi:hypothetical protein
MVEPRRCYTRELAPGVLVHSSKTPSLLWSQNFEVECCRIPPQTARFRLDFRGSENVQILTDQRTPSDGTGAVGSDEGVVVVEAQPFVRTFAARLELEDESTAAVVKSKFSFEFLEIHERASLRQAAKAAALEISSTVIHNDVFSVPPEALHEPSQEFIARMCRLGGTKFVDESMKPLVELSQQPVAWRRFPGTALLLSGYIGRGDIRGGLTQGAYTALAALAGCPQIIESIFGVTAPAEGSTWGGYCLTLYPDGLRQMFVVDDYLPCFPLDGGGTMMTSSHSGDAWVAILEKALAKCFGGYEGLDKVDCISQCMTATGFPARRIEIEKNAITGASLLQHNIQEWAREGWPIMAMTGARSSSPLESDLPPRKSYNISPCGLVQMPSGDVLVHVRGPVQAGSWKGAWASGSHLWSKEARRIAADALGEACEYTNDGSFWMSVRECTQNFVQVGAIMAQPKWSVMRRRLSYFPHALTQLYSLSVIEDTRAFFSAHIPEEDSKGGSTGIVVLRIRGDFTFEPVVHSLSSGSPLVHGHHFIPALLSPAQYLVVLVDGTVEGARPDSAHLQDRYDAAMLGHHSPPQANIALDEIFDRLDGDCDGVLSADELGCFLLEREGVCLSPEALVWIMEHFDSKSNGITKQGFHECYKFMWQDSGRNLNVILRDLSHFGYRGREMVLLDKLKRSSLVVHVEQASASVNLVPHPNDPKARELAAKFLFA